MPVCRGPGAKTNHQVIAEHQTRLTELLRQLNLWMPSVATVCLEAHSVSLQWFRVVTSHCIAMENYIISLATTEEIRFLSTLFYLSNVQLLFFNNNRYNVLKELCERLLFLEESLTNAGGHYCFPPLIYRISVQRGSGIVAEIKRRPPPRKTVLFRTS